jgi:hypothetical protein
MKKTTMALTSFGLGVVILATSAFAEVASKSGYEKAKDTIKSSVGYLVENSSSSTITIEYVIRDSGKVIQKYNSTEKSDKKNNVWESSSYSEDDVNGKTNNYNYRDRDGSISGNGDKYEKIRFADKIDYEKGYKKSPFKEDNFEDYEKIFEALIGNLKNAVIEENSSTKTKEYSFNLNESQFPPVINAMSSLAFKKFIFTNKYNQEQNKMVLPVISKDIFIKNAEGKMTVEKDGYVQKGTAKVNLTGKDEKDKVHDVSIEMLIQLTDIDKTSIKKPDLTGKKVVERVEQMTKDSSISKKYIGKWKSDIITSTDDKLIKKGERVFEILSVDSENLTGKYYEVLKDSKQQPEINSFEFKGKVANTNFVIIDGDKEIKQIFFNNDQMEVVIWNRAYSFFPVLD